MPKLNINITGDAAQYDAAIKGAIKVTEEAGTAIKDKLGAATKETSKATETLAGKTQTLRQQLREATNDAFKLTEKYGLQNKATQEAITKAGILKDKQQDLTALIDAARPDAPFKALGNVLKSSAQGFAGVTGAMALFGDKSKETQEMLLKVQAALALVTATEAIDGLKDSFMQLNMVIARNPLGAALVGFIAVTAAITAFSQETDKMALIEKKAAGAHLAEKVELERLLSVINDSNASYKEKEAALKKINAQNPEYLGGLTLEKNTQTEITAAVGNYIKVLELKSRAQAAQELYVEALKKQQAIERELGERAGHWATALSHAYTRSFSLPAAKRHADEYKKIFVDLSNELDSLSSTQASSFGAPATAPKAAKIQSSATDWNIGVGALKARDDYKMAAHGIIDANKDIVKSVKYTAKESTTRWEQTIASINGSINSFIVDGISMIAESIGEVMAGGNLDDLGKQLMQAVGGLLSTLSKALIAYGIASSAFFSGNPAAAIPAGIAMGVLAGIIKKQFGGKGDKSAGVPSAGGGFQYGGGVGTRYSGSFSSSNNTSGQLVAKIKGQDLLITFDRAKNYKGRVM